MELSESHTAQVTVELSLGFKLGDLVKIFPKVANIYHLGKH